MLKKLKADFKILKSGADLKDVDKIILPGVGAFPKAMENLKKFGFIEKIINYAGENKYILGICLGMQLLFEKSIEFGETKGLGLIPGSIEKINTTMALPHMGWNDLTIKKEIPILKEVSNGADVYFVHSFMAKTSDKYIAATTDYDEIIPAVVCNKNIFGTQFHPEKSKKWGELILKNFINI